MLKKHQSVYGYKTRLAQAAGCRNSYFSQVLHGKFDLAPEHALGLAEFWGLSAAEKDYWIGLVHLARASTPELKRYHESLLRKQAANQERERLRGSAQEVVEDSKALFYSSWRYTAVHELTTFSGGRSAEAIARRLELPAELVKETLRDLEAMGLVEQRGSAWHAKIAELIVPVDTSYSAQHIAHWTARAALDASRRKRALPSFHKSWVCGVSRADYERLRELLLDHVGKCQKIIPGSPREELVCLGLHLFGV